MICLRNYLMYTIKNMPYFIDVNQSVPKNPEHPCTEIVNVEELPNPLPEGSGDYVVSSLRGGDQRTHES